MVREQCLIFHKVLTLMALVLYSVVYSVGEERELHAERNPQCPLNLCNNSTRIKMLHIWAVGSNDTLHYFWSFQRKPSVLLVLTSLESNISNISWDPSGIGINSLSFTHPPKYAFGFVVNELYEFNDVDDTGKMDVNSNNDSYTQKLRMPDTWDCENFDSFRDYVRLTMVGSWNNSQPDVGNKKLVRNGTIRIELEAFRSQDHSESLPHLLHSANATLLDIQLQNLTTDSGFKQSRYAFEFILAANESSSSEIKSNSFKSLDDEHTPGVFTLADLHTSASKDCGRGGYVQWRPVAYVADERDIVNSTGMVMYGVRNVTKPFIKLSSTLLAAFFGAHLDDSLVQAVNISFGEKEDGFYAKSKFISWTATVGYGFPPEERFSLVVILVISVGLGLPAILIILSGIYVAVRRISRRKDDLFLSR